MLIGAVSDTHGRPYKLKEKVDILFHAGDLTIAGTWEELIYAIDQILDQPADERVVTLGNHDSIGEEEDARVRALFKEKGIVYLRDEEATVKGLRVYGSPYTLEFGRFSFQLPRDDWEAAEKHWARVPEGIDVLLTHSPPWGRFDVPFGSYNHVGCPDLMRAVQRTKPRVHIFGHIHSPGEALSSEGIRFINAAVTSTAGGVYKAAYDPIIFELTDER